MSQGSDYHHPTLKQVAIRLILIVAKFDVLVTSILAFALVFSLCHLTHGFAPTFALVLWLQLLEAEADLFQPK